MTEPTEGRRVFNAHTTPFLPYDLEGPVQPEMSWLPVSFDRESGQGCYLLPIAMFRLQRVDSRR